MKGLFYDAAALPLGTVGMILGALFTNEALGFLSRFSRFLVECAVRRLPNEHRDEHREEWLATLEYEAQDGKKLSELYAALQAWSRAEETAMVLESSLTPTRQAEELQVRGTRSLFLGAAIYFFINAFITFTELALYDGFGTNWWLSTLFAVSFVPGIGGMIWYQMLYRRAKKLEDGLQGS